MNYLGFHKNDLEKVVNELNNLLCSYHVYYQNLRNFHWNIQGENFFELHAQFELLYNDARLKIDEIAERILTLRQRPLSRISDYLELSEIEESHVLDNDRDMVKTVLQNHTKLINKLRKIIKVASECGDEGTVDMSAGFLKDFEKRSWMLDAWMSKKAELVM